MAVKDENNNTIGCLIDVYYNIYYSLPGFISVVGNFTLTFKVDMFTSQDGKKYNQYYHVKD